MWNSRQQSGFDVAIWLDLSATQKVSNPHIVITSPWQMSKVASFTCITGTVPEPEGRSRTSSENNWDFPDSIAEAIIRGDAQGKCPFSLTT